MNIPPIGSLCGGSGKTTGLADALKEINAGDYRDCPLGWECGFRSAAERIGIKVVTRRLIDHKTVRVYRIE